MNESNSINSGWCGTLELIYTQRYDETILKHNLATAPLKIQRPFYPEGKSICHSIILHTAGGVVGGDRLEQKINLQANSHALITTATAGKIYLSNGQIAKQQTKIKLEAGAILEWVPQETIVFNGAQYWQNLQVELGENATFIGWEINRFGRTARGEDFLQGEWRSHTEIWREKPLWIERQWLPGKEDIFYTQNGLAGQPVVGTFIYMGQPIDKNLLEEIKALWQNKDYQGQIGVSTLLEDGLLCRYRGSSTQEISQYFIEVWGLLRLKIWQRPLIKPRVWQK